MKINKVEITKEIIAGEKENLFVIAGPCVIENEDHSFFIAKELREIARKLKVPFVFKASFDKANRTSIKSYRGPGLKKGLEILNNIRSKLKVPVISDVHDVAQVETAAEVLDIIQIPAFLCRQTDLIVAVGKTGKPVNVKKGQFLSPWDVKNIIDKIISTGNKRILITERGTSFGYNNLIVDMKSFPVIRSFGYPVIFDITHSLQLPGGMGRSSGGQSEYIFPLGKAGVAAGADGVFVEVHDNPPRALSDGPNALKLDQIYNLLNLLKEIYKISR